MFNVDFEMIGYDWGDWRKRCFPGHQRRYHAGFATVDTGFNMLPLNGLTKAIKALPDNWQEAYPNIYNYVVNSSLLMLLPKMTARYIASLGVYYHFTTGDTYPDHTLYYRADWAKEIGL